MQPALMPDNAQGGENLAIPAAAAIIEKEVGGKRYILLQTRHKPEVSPAYTGLFEIPAGCIRTYEDIFETLKREIKEETGQKADKIINLHHSGRYDYGKKFQKKVGFRGQTYVLFIAGLKSKKIRIGFH